MGSEAYIEQTRTAVRNYYRSAERGYWEDLDGACHYGYTPDSHEGSFDMPEAQRALERLVGETLNLPQGSDVLDAGCGYGPLSRMLVDEFDHNVTGIDLIPYRLQRHQGLNREEGMDGMVSLANVDYHHLPFEDESFDGVATLETLVHAHDYEQVLSEFHRVLRPGGRVVLFEYTIPELSGVPQPARGLAEKVIRETGMASLPHFTHGSFPRILEDAGFADASSKDISRNVYPSWFHVWKLSVKNAADEFRKGNIGLDSFPGSTWVWPARKQLGYTVNQATKPV